jgi:ABC-2 type transport system permease protein
VFAVTLKELRQIRRDRRTLVILLFIPAFFLFLYGYALNFDIRHVSLAVEDRDGSVESRRLISSFIDSTYFDLHTTVTSGQEVDRLVDRLDARAVLVIPADFSRKIREGRTADVQLLLDGDNANTATTVLGYATAVLREASREVAGMPTVRLAGVEPRVWYNPELRSTLFLVPGLVAYISMITAVVSTALSIVREKENGTMEQIRMAPISTGAFIAGKTLPYLILSQVSALLVILAAMVLFGLPMRGDWFALGLVIAVFLVGALGTGLLVSTMADTQQVAFQLAMVIAFLPTFMLSGFIYPIASMPTVLQWVTTIVPARYFLVALRGIVLKGATIGSLLRPISLLTAYAIVVLSLAALRLAKR